MPQEAQYIPGVGGKLHLVDPMGYQYHLMNDPLVEGGLKTEGTLSYTCVWPSCVAGAFVEGTMVTQWFGNHNHQVTNSQFEGQEGGEAIFIANKFGRPQLLDPLGFHYIKKWKKVGTKEVFDDARVTWRCAQYHESKCKASAVTLNNVVQAWRGFHNHPRDKAKGDKAVFVPDPKNGLRRLVDPNGFLLSKHEESQEKSFWRCSQRHLYKCKAVAHVFPDGTVEFRRLNQHFHPAPSSSDQ